MNISEWLIPSMIKLRDARVDSPRRDCLVLLEDTIHKDRAWVVAHPEVELSQKTIQKLNTLIERRIEREPLAYIRQRAWFYGRFFAVSPNVLVPRPESENFIALLNEIALPPQKIVDIGTGSGMLAITAKLECPSSIVIATDISSQALSIAKKNAATHHVEIQFLSGSLFEPLANEQLENSIVLANLPYVPEAMITSPEITHEPSEALFSGVDGLEHYQNFWQQVKDVPGKPLHILTEALESQHAAVAKMAYSSGYILEKTSILVQQFSRA